MKALIRGEDVSSAFDAGRATIRAEETERRINNPTSNFDSIVNVPQLLARNEALSVADFSDHVIKAPPPLNSFDMKASYMDRGFVGRRGQIRQTLKIIEDRENFIVFKGPGGIGKSTLSTRIVADLSRHGCGIIDFASEVNPPAILEKLSNILKELDADKAKVLEQGQAEPDEKLRLLLGALCSIKPRWVILFDNFEDNVDEENERVASPELQGFLLQMKKTVKGTDVTVMFSTRYRIEDFKENEIEVRDFSPVEFRKKLAFTRALKFIDTDSLGRMRDTYGRNPRALELLDSLAWCEYKEEGCSWQDIQENLLPELIKQIDQGDGKDAFSPLLLGRLFRFLTKSQVALLKAVAVYFEPVPENALQTQDVAIRKPDRDRLVGLSLLEYRQSAETQLYMHRLTATYLLDVENGYVEQTERHELHLQAAQWWKTRLKETEAVDEAISARRHYLEAQEWDKAAELALGLESVLSRWGYMQFAMSLNVETLQMPISDKNRAETLSRLGNSIHSTGQPGEALKFYEQSLSLYRELKNKSGVANQLGNIGTVFMNTGKPQEALEIFQQSLAFHMELGNKQNEARSLGNIGNVYMQTGKPLKALESYEQTLTLLRELGDRLGEANQLGNIGLVYLDTGKPQEALETHQAALKINEDIEHKLGQAQDISNIGLVYMTTDMHREALENFEYALELHRELGNKQGEAIALGNIGIVNMEYPNHRPPCPLG